VKSVVIPPIVVDSDFARHWSTDSVSKSRFLKEMAFEAQKFLERRANLKRLYYRL